MLKILTREEEFDSFLESNRDKLVLVKFSTSWCSPCHELQKNLEKLLAEKKNLAVLEIDAEKFSRLAQRSIFSVRSVPSLFLFRKNHFVKGNIGNMSVEQLKKFVDS